MTIMSVNFHMEEHTEAKTTHIADSAVLKIINKGAYSSGITIFGPASAKAKFDQIAALFNEALNTTEGN